MNLQEIVEQIEYLKKNMESELTMKNLYLMSKIVNTQFLAPKVKRLFKHSIRLKNRNRGNLSKYLIDILD